MHKADLLKEIEHQLSLGPDDLAKEDRFYWSATLTRSHPPQGRHKVTGFWGYTPSERRHAYATKEGRKHKADNGNTRDGHKKFYGATKTNTAYAQLRYADAEQFPSKIKAWMRDTLSPRFRLQRCFASLCLWRMKTPFWLKLSR